MIGGEAATIQANEREAKVATVIENGQQFAVAIQLLLPDLSVVPSDIAAGFDVGAGADLLAFQKLGFKHALWTNEPEPLLVTQVPKFFADEANVLTDVLAQLPVEYAGTSLTAREWLAMADFQPKLTTMLHIAPMHFRAHDPAEMLKHYGKFALRLPQENAIILSAYDDHQHSQRGFVLAHDYFLAQGLRAQLYLNEQTAQFSSIGSRVLVLHGGAR
jgi:hypothetical protein